MAYVGMEYTVIGWARNKPLLDSEHDLLTLLHDVCRAIGMRKLKSMAVHVELELNKLKSERFEDEGGATASLILSTSHASIHGWPDRSDEAGFFWLSIGSCREFEISTVDRVLVAQLDLLNVDRYIRKVNVPPIHMRRGDAQGTN